MPVGIQPAPSGTARSSSPAPQSHGPTTVSDPRPRRTTRVRPHHALALAVVLVAVALLLRYDWAAPDRATTPARPDTTGAAATPSSQPPTPPLVSPSTSTGSSNATLPVARQSSGDSVSPFLPPWDVATFQTALASESLGSTVVATPVRQPFMSVPGTVLQLTRRAQPVGTAQVYVYGDAVIRGRDTDQLDSVRVSPRTTSIRWQYPPTLITSNNMAVVVLASDPTISALVRRAVDDHARLYHP